MEAWVERPHRLYFQERKFTAQEKNIVRYVATVIKIILPFASDGKMHDDPLQDTQLLLRLWH